VERLHAVESLRLTGRVTLGPVVGSLRVEFKRPGRMRMELGLPQGTLLRLFDGTEGWTSEVASPTPALVRMSAEELVRARREADMDGPLLDAESKGIRFANAGKDEAQGRTNRWAGRRADKSTGGRGWKRRAFVPAAA
jgi:hypothetical protein